VHGCAPPLRGAHDARGRLTGARRSRPLPGIMTSALPTRGSSGLQGASETPGAVSNARRQGTPGVRRKRPVSGAALCGNTALPARLVAGAARRQSLQGVGVRAPLGHERHRSADKLCAHSDKPGADGGRGAEERESEGGKQGGAGGGGEGLLKGAASLPLPQPPVTTRGWGRGSQNHRRAGSRAAARADLPEGLVAAGEPVVYYGPGGAARSVAVQGRRRPRPRSRRAASPPWACCCPAACRPPAALSSSCSCCSWSCAWR